MLAPFTAWASPKWVRRPFALSYTMYISLFRGGGKWRGQVEGVEGAGGGAICVCEPYTKIWRSYGIDSSSKPFLCTSTHYLIVCSLYIYCPLNYNIPAVKLPYKQLAGPVHSWLIKLPRIIRIRLVKTTDCLSSVVHLPLRCWVVSLLGQAFLIYWCRIV